MADRGRRSILVLTADRLGRELAGPAIRALAIADELAGRHDVTLVSLQPGEPVERPYPVLVDPGEARLRAVAERQEIVVAQGWVLGGRPYLTTEDMIVVADIYDPMHLEQLEQGHEAGTDEGRRQAVHGAVSILNHQLRRADFMVCASEKQRDLWLGQLAGLGRINPRTYDQDPTLRRLLDVVPFGLPAEPPRHTRPAVRGVVPGIGPDDPLLLWGGGIYNWFDPLTLLRAVDRLRSEHPTVRLYFMGLRHPNPEIPTMRMAHEAQQLSSELGLTGTTVFFNEGWVPYADRQDVLLEADLGVSTHLDHVETAFSFRTRILDYLWAGLPVVATEGDALGELVAAEALGATVAAGDVAGLHDALDGLLRSPERRAAARARIEVVRERFTWDRVLDPIARFCDTAGPAADRADPAARADIDALQWDRPVAQGWRGSVQRAADHLAEEGAGATVGRALRRLGRTGRPDG
jgi:glycosyltransferase involved in cell wall biosynthesis